jgi:hypothetical protein
MKSRIFRILKGEVLMSLPKAGRFPGAPHCRWKSFTLLNGFQGRKLNRILDEGRFFIRCFAVFRAAGLSVSRRILSMIDNRMFRKCCVSLTNSGIKHQHPVEIFHIGRLA